MSKENLIGNYFVSKKVDKILKFELFWSKFEAKLSQIFSSFLIKHELIELLTKNVFFKFEFWLVKNWFSDILESFFLFQTFSMKLDVFLTVSRLNRVKLQKNFWECQKASKDLNSVFQTCQNDQKHWFKVFKISKIIQNIANLTKINAFSMFLNLFLLFCFFEWHF